MDHRSQQLLDRVGAAAGIAAMLLLVALFMFFPALPAPDHGIAAIARKARDNSDALLLAAYVGALMSGALLLFGAALAARLRRAEGSVGGWWLVALVGIAATSIGIVGNALAIVLVRAVGHGAHGSGLWVGYGADHWLGVLIAIPLAVFLLGASMGARVSTALPRWVAWLGIAVSVLLVVGAGSVTGDEVDGGILGVPLLLGYLGLIVWIVAASITMARRPVDVGEPEPVAAVA
jgi:hypothetical protein